MSKSSKIFTVIGFIAFLGAAVLVNSIFFSDSNGLPKYRGDDVANAGNDPFLNKIPGDLRNKYENELVKLKKELKDNPGDTEKWIQVGIIKKVFNNYAGARDAWEYAKIVNPNYSVAYFNLGDLYGSYLKDMETAKKNYLKAIDIDPAVGQYYVALAQFYKFFYTDKEDETDDILVRGLKEIPNDEGIKYQLTRYWKQEGLSDQEINKRLAEIVQE